MPMQGVEKYVGQLAPHYHNADEEDPVFRNKEARMFHSGFMEFFSRVHPIVPLLFYGPVVTYSAWSALRLGLSVPLLLALVAVGVLMWTLTEYVLHRFVFHVSPSNAVSKFIYFYSHGIHHQYPDDFYRLVMVPIISAPLAIAFVALFHAVLPTAFAHAAFGGFALGYLGYDYTHFATHHVRPPRAKWLAPFAKWLRSARRHHLCHHFDNHNCGFGVSTPLWDHVFGTYDTARHAPRE